MPTVVLVVLGLGFFLFGCAFLVIVGWIFGATFRRHKEGAPQKKRKASRILSGAKIAVVVAAASCVAAFVYALHVEPYWPQVTETTIATAALPRGGQPIRIVHLTDTHSDPESRLEPQLPALVATLEPDLIVFTGDSINSAPALPAFRKLMTDLAAVAPTYAVRGNWDVWYWAELDLFGGTNVHELDGAEELDVRGTKIWIGGSPVDATASAAQLLKSRSSHHDVAIFLHHFPEKAAEALRAGADLSLAGDTHGGQVRAPFWGALVRMTRFGEFFEMGLHPIEGKHLYVNRGIGMEGGDAPRIRFLCRPEVALLTIAPR